MQRIFSALIAFLCAGQLLAGESANSNIQPYFSFHSLGYSETAPIHQIVINDIEGPYFDGGRHSFTHNIIESGAKYNGWKLAAIYRYDYSLEYSEDTAELIYGDRNNLSIEKNRQYDVELELIHARTAGFKFGYEWSVLPELQLGLDLSYLEVSYFLDGYLEGEFMADNDSYSGQLFIDYAYTKDLLPLDREAEEPDGWGYALDFSWLWQMNESWYAKGAFIDLLSQLYIDEAPFTYATANSDRVSFDDNGTIDVKPLLSGREGYRKETLSLPKQISLDVYYRINIDFEMGIAWYRYGDVNFPSIINHYNFSEGSSLKTKFDFKSEALTIGASFPWLTISLTSDRLDYKKARTLGFDAGVYLAF